MSTAQLDLFEGQAVRQATITLAGANKKFREALAVQPRQFQIGESTRMTIEVACVGVHFDPTDDDGPLCRVHVMKLVDAHYGNGTA